MLLLNVDVYPLNFSNQPKVGTSVFSQQAIIKSLRGCGAYHAHSGRNLKGFKKVSGLVFKHLCLSSKSIIFILRWDAGAAASYQLAPYLVVPMGDTRSSWKAGRGEGGFTLSCWLAGFVSITAAMVLDLVRSSFHVFHLHIERPVFQPQASCSTP